MPTRTLRGASPLAVALLATLACGPSEEMQQQLSTLSAQNDSLIQEVADNARFLSDISADLAKVQVEGAALDVTAESPQQARRDSIRQRIRYITARLDESATRLQESRRRIRALDRLSDSLRTTLESTIENYESMIADHRTTITSLREQLALLEADNERLVAENEVLVDSVETLEEDKRTVYYVVGTKQELRERGIIREEGGARFLFVLWRRGETVVPARELDPSQFTSIDMREVTQIPLPEPNREYRIASRQDLTYLDAPVDESGKIQGADTLRITAPDRFWQPSKFLIIVQG